ncbi:MAG: hypothetical protein ACMUIE_09265 [Thermoplasmatota archaeon]
MLLIGTVTPFTRTSVELEESRMTIYEMLGEDGEVLFIGIGNIKYNLRQHLPGGWFPLMGAKYYRTFKNLDSENLETLRNNLIKDHVDIIGRPPRFNQPLSVSKGLLEDYDPFL